MDNRDNFSIVPGSLARMSPRKVKVERAEFRWPVIAAVLTALTLYGLLPSDFWLPMRLAVVALGIALLIPIVIVNPMRLRTQTRVSRAFSLALTALLALANLSALVQLICLLATAAADQAGLLLGAAAQVWATHVIAFALVYWEIDRGGPVMRTLAPRAELPPADIRFPQDEDAEAVREVSMQSSERTDWTANYIDYLYFSAANTMAFSPPDAVPLTPRAKSLVGIQALGAYILLVLVIARAVALLG